MDVIRAWNGLLREVDSACQRWICSTRDGVNTRIKNERGLEGDDLLAGTDRRLEGSLNSLLAGVGLVPEFAADALVECRCSLLEVDVETTLGRDAHHQTVLMGTGHSLFTSRFFTCSRE
jgi:hypothetical protein